LLVEEVLAGLAFTAFVACVVYALKMAVEEAEGEEDK